MKTHRFLLTLLLICSIVLLLFVSCDCGDDDDDDDDATVDDDDDDDDDVTDDDDITDDDDDDNDTVTGPTIVGTTPDDGDIELKLATSLLITFSEEMDTSSVEAAFSMDDGTKAAVSGTFAWDNMNTTMTFTPDSDLEENTKYTATLAATAMSAAGQAMANAFETEFTTVDLWVLLIDGGDNGYDDGEAITVGPEGNYFFTGTLDLYDDSMFIQEVDINATELDSTFYSSPDGDTEGHAITLDDSGNIYVGGGSDVAGQSKDNWVRKYDSAWTEQWTDLYNGSDNSWEYVDGIAVDGSGNVYATGTENVTGQSNNFWLRKYDSAGTVLWTETHDGADSQSDRGFAVALDGTAVYVAGVEVTSGQANNIWVRKYDSDGNDLWTDVYNGADNQNDTGYGIAVDSAGNVYVAGIVWVSGEKDNIWLRKYDPAGAVLWTQTYNKNDGDDRGHAVAVDRDDNIIVAGRETPGTKAADPTDAVVLKYDPDGNLLWTYSYDGAISDYDTFEGVCTDGYGNIIAVGNSFASASDKDILVVKLDSDGNAE